MGVQTILNCLTKSPGKRLVQVSTDEVYGEVLGNPSKETDRINPSSAYSASKASAELLIFAEARTHGISYNVTRGCNTYGTGQNPEKIIPHFIECAKNGLPCPIYGDGMQIREWLNVQDHVLGIWKVGTSQFSNQVFNLGSGFRLSNLSLLELMKKLSHRLDFTYRLVSDRLGHDRQYAIDSFKAKHLLNFIPTVKFESGLKDVLDAAINE